ncbi:hypothetical protein MLD38_011793 [Melastoma candidum]|uniref:Uncharacterized protein n=1 Tax=Melastoma candidum TaxID=119954 RepID=A0ACB9R5I6_9MYRT|nr:hypothetical protein MLD38_011793 [Melastoma candidum]
MAGISEVSSENRQGGGGSEGKSAEDDRGGWKWAGFLLVNQGLTSLAFLGVGESLVLFLTRVLGLENAAAASKVNNWTGVVYLCSIVGAFLSDSYLGRYRTCSIFQLIFILGMVLLSVSSSLFLLSPPGCGNGKVRCAPTSKNSIAMFYISMYLIALGYGGNQPAVATFGADQFGDMDPKARTSKGIFFGYFYLMHNFGSLFSDTVLVYLENLGRWTLGFQISTCTAVIALLLFWVGTMRYRYVTPSGNPLPRVAQVLVAAVRKRDVIPANEEDLYELLGSDSAIKGSRKIRHSDKFRCLDKAATVTAADDKCPRTDAWRLCTVTQMGSLFIIQGDAMDTRLGHFHIPAASMNTFNIFSVLVSTGIYRPLLVPLIGCLITNKNGVSELQRMGIGLMIGFMAMVSAGITEILRLRHVMPGESKSALSVLWQVPQYVLVGASEVFMYVGQLEFFNGQAPDGMKSLGCSLSMASISLGNYVSSMLVNMVTKATARDGGRSGWIPNNLNDGHLDRFFFLIAGLTGADFAVYLLCARWYKPIKIEEDSKTKIRDENQFIEL